ncbi:MAG: TolC family protein [Aquificae bacterium]|nr:TolC family protein [Aquificota bacterium]
MLKVLVLIVTFLSEFSFAITVEQLAENIAKNHPKIKSIEYRLKALKERQTFENSLPDPVITFSINDIQLFYRPFARNLEPMQTINFGFSQKIPYLPKLKQKSKIIKVKYNKTYYKLLLEKLELKFDIYKHVYLFWQTKEKLKVLEEFKNIAKHLIEFSNTLYSIGKISQAEVFNTNVFYSELLQREVFLKGRLKQIESSFAYFSEVSLKEIDIKVTYPSDVLELNIFLKFLKRNNPQLLVLKEELKEAKEKVKLAKLDYKPDFSVFATYAYRNPFRDYVSFGGSFNIPLWAKKKQEKKVLEESFYKLSKKKKLLDIEKMLISKLQEEYYKAKTSYESFKVFHQYLKPQTQKVYEGVLSEYQVGKKNIFDVLKALNQILTVRQKIIDETVNYHIAYKNIQKLMGTLK